MDYRTMNRNVDTSTSSSQHSTLARPITLNFSDDDDEFESHIEDNDENHTACSFSSPHKSPEMSSSRYIKLP